jgi:23S rRNA (cytidine1920-2'-O)/16S rRNA (cytidine1409-2'-O)-methyltransferase
MAERGLVGSRELAQKLILTGRVLVNNQKIEKCGAAVAPDSDLRVVGDFPRYVSRGGSKLEAALDYFQVDPCGKTCLDIGSSTGGFTDCLLQRGAGKVYAVDVGTNQLDWRIRQNPKVVALERTHARTLRAEQFGELMDLVTMDVSFISVTLILPVLPALLRPGGIVLVLVKPQFEAGRGKVGKGGIVRDPEVQRDAVEKVARKLIELGFAKPAAVESALEGAQGNREFFLYSGL